MTADRQPLERRGLLESAQVEAGAHGPVLSGFAIRFNLNSEPLPGKGGSTFVEQIAPSALRRLGQQRDVKFLIGHDATRVMGATKSGTLELEVVTDGLRFRLSPPNSPDGQNLVESVRRGDLDGISFGFRALADAWRSTDVPPVRVVTDLDLFEISAVAWPAYREAGVMVEARAMDHAAAVWAEHSARTRADEIRALDVRLAELRQATP